jgi:hypothetical protein
MKARVLLQPLVVGNAQTRFSVGEENAREE